MILKGICKSYGEKTVLRDLSLEFKEGKITSVLGESGAGKTTLLNILAGLLPCEGEIDGVSCAKARRRAGCSYLFQESKLLPNLTVGGNLKFVLPKTEWGKIGDALARVGLAGREGERPSALSGGERQRVAVARAFLYPHSLLLMDEPFSSLDLSLKKSLIELVYELWEERGDTVVFVTHDVREAALLSHRALLLKGGTIALDLPVSEPFPRDFLTPPAAERTLFSALLAQTPQ